MNRSRAPSPTKWERERGEGKLSGSQRAALRAAYPSPSQRFASGPSLSRFAGEG